jgi:hypothetical protein
MNNSIKRYNQIVKQTPRDIKILTFIPSPSDIDYRRGFIKRYFVQKTNDKGSPIYEISKRDINKYKTNPLYTSVDLRWRIKGPKETQYDDEGNVSDKAVSESNRVAIRLVADKIPNLKLYLPNLLQFYKN